MTRAEHVRWMKERALQELEFSGITGAYASLLSDIGKHPETENLRSFMAMALPLATRDERAMREFIDGFAE